MHHRLVILIVMLLVGLPAAAETVTIEAGRDATLIESADGAKANGSGPNFFAGHTSQQQNGRRRGLLYFDVAGALPDKAHIESVSLTLYSVTGNPEPRDVRLHLVLADWGEGPSSASGGGGAPSEYGDATWIHTFYDTEQWVHRGGQFVARASAALEVGDAGYYTWDDAKHLVRDVRIWNAAPHRNFGWILFGDETTQTTAKKFASRENPDLALRPVLEISYSTR